MDARRIAMLLLLSLGCSSALTQSTVSELDILRGRADSASFARALAPRDFRFPADHGPHPQFRHEWWYFTGNLDSASGQRFGFELTFFRLGLVPQPAPHARPEGANSPAGVASQWRAGELYVAHMAVTDVARGRFRFAQRYSRAALGLAGAEADPLHVWVDDWAVGAVAGGWELRAGGAEYALQLQVQPLSAPVLNGDHGLSVKSGEPGAASYYYSIPRLAVQGRIQRGGESIQVHGLAWLDREWGSGALGPREVGWDWFALQLHDGSSLMFYALRNQDGSRDPHSAGTWVDASGQAHPLANDDVSIEVTDRWLSPRGARYPAGWRLRVPPLGIDATLRPVLADQELATRPRYWEGAVDVRGTEAQRPLAGRGYVELVGYGE